MIGDRYQATWFRRLAIEQALANYYDLTLKFPSLANMIKVGKPANRDNTNAWRNLLKAYASLISQIYYASRGEVKRSGESSDLFEHGNSAINFILRDSWVAFARINYLFSTDEVGRFVRRRAEEIAEAEAETDRLIDDVEPFNA